MGDAITGQTYTVPDVPDYEP